MASNSSWFREIKNGKYQLLSKIMKYTTSLYLFSELATNWIVSSDKSPIDSSEITVKVLEPTIIWKIITSIRDLSTRVIVIECEIEIQQLVCNLFHVLRLFGVTLEDKKEFRRVIGKNRHLVYYEEENTKLNDTNEMILPGHSVDKLREEYEQFRVGEDNLSKWMRVLYDMMGNIVYKTIAQHDGCFKRQCRHFRISGIKSLNNAILPVLSIYEYDDDDDDDDDNNNNNNSI